MFSKILVPLDGSDCSLKALEYASDIANRSNSSLVLLYVIDSPTKFDNKNIMGFVTPKILDQITEEARNEVERWSKKIWEETKTKNKCVLKTDVILGVSPIYIEIVTYAENENTDLIVIGSRGKTGLRKILLGSTASGVVTYSHCPVIVINC